MTENEAIEKLKYTKRNFGMPIQGDTWKPNAETVALDIAIKALEEIQQYCSIGTVEECREAMEKQNEKKPVMKQFYEDMEEKSLCCPTCGDILTDRIPGENKDFYYHCLTCGQKFDWSNP